MNSNSILPSFWVVVSVVLDGLGIAVHAADCVATPPPIIRATDLGSLALKMGRLMQPIQGIRWRQLQQHDSQRSDRPRT